VQMVLFVLLCILLHTKSRVTQRGLLPVVYLHPFLQRSKHLWFVLSLF
jgi:hypothetical protein